MAKLEKGREANAAARAEKGRKEAKAIAKIDRLIHEPARLNVMAHLFVVEGADFLFLMRQTNLTFGNLSSHLSKLEAAGYLQVKKEFVEKKPHTMLSLTKKGRAAFQTYTGNMKKVFAELPK
ncbi:Winged helix DNA-binding domain protein [Candidatus Burarchaeum australiense]|nr:Winged helix DNA-binding domain protein [Candidatus Burarchaeum australiense]